MNLIEVHFAEVDKTVFVEPGTTLLKAAELASVDILTGCTRGMCGTDAHRIEAAAEALEPPSDDERGTLDRMGVEGHCRLLCSARVRAGRVIVAGDALTD
ncbi:MAG: 2Fe-2S iron-sulfur cluster-binding protein [Planctomycetota bacterium]